MGRSKNKPILPSHLTHMARCIASQHWGLHPGSSSLLISSYFWVPWGESRDEHWFFSFLFQTTEIIGEPLCCFFWSPTPSFWTTFQKWHQSPYIVKFNIYRTKFTLEPRCVWLWLKNAQASESRLSLGRKSRVVLNFNWKNASKCFSYDLGKYAYHKKMVKRTQKDVWYVASISGYKLSQDELKDSIMVSLLIAIHESFGTSCFSCWFWMQWETVCLWLFPYSFWLWLHF